MDGRVKPGYDDWVGDRRDTAGTKRVSALGSIFAASARNRCYESDATRKSTVADRHDLGGGPMVASTMGPVPASWDPREDRRIYPRWIAIFWLAMVLGFGVHSPGFLKQQPPPPQIVYLHAVVFTGWLVIVTTQIALIRRNAFAWHRRLGLAALFVAAAIL